MRGRAWLRSFPNTWASRGVVFNKNQKFGLIGARLQEVKVLDFCSDICPIENCVRVPNCSECQNVKRALAAYGGMWHCLLTCCSCLQREYTIPLANCAITWWKGWTFAVTFVRPKMSACVTLNYSNSFRPPFSDTTTTLHCHAGIRTNARLITDSFVRPFVTLILWTLARS